MPQESVTLEISSLLRRITLNASSLNSLPQPTGPFPSQQVLQKAAVTQNVQSSPHRPEDPGVEQELSLFIPKWRPCCSRPGAHGG